MIRRPVTDDIAALKQLWRNQLKEPESNIESIFRNLFNPDMAWVYEKNNEIASMVYMLPCTIIYEKQELPVYYLYGLASNPEIRGHALELLDAAYNHVCEQGCIAALATVLIPKLFRHYERIGFEACSLIKNVDLAFNDSLIFSDSATDIQCLDSIGLNELRKTILNNPETVQWPVNQIEFELNGFVNNKKRAISIQKNGITAYALYCVNQDHALIVEFACSSIADSKNLLREICRNIPAKQFTIHTPPALLPGTGEKTYRGIIKKCTAWPNRINPSDIYINLDFAY